MKNKIILLLVLLIPSLCFGESILFQYTFNGDSKECRFTINGTSFEKITILLPLKEKNSWSKFAEDSQGFAYWIQQFWDLEDIFPLKFKASAIESLFFNSEKGSFEPIRATDFIEEIAIKNNYSITDRETISSGKNFVTWKYYLYKPDK